MRTFSVHTEFRQLKEAIVCRPSNYFKSDPINVVEQHYLKKEPPTRRKLMKEHEVWAQTLKKLGVKLIFLKSTLGLPHQLFTRDVAFAIGEHFFLANMAKDIRKGETKILEEWLHKNKILFKRIPEGLIEGGDVLIHGTQVFVGLSQRTNRRGVRALAKLLGPSWEVIPIRLRKQVLHLDCVLAILNASTIIWCPDLILSHHKLLKNIFKKRIKISKEEAFHMAANVLTVNPGNILVGAMHKRLQKELKQVGIKVHLIEWKEIKKLGGLFRCATCPLS